MISCKNVRKDVLLIHILIPLLVGGFTALLTGDSMNIYQTIRTPSFAPPGFLFPIVWTILYILMGVSSYLIYTTAVPGKKVAKEIKEALFFYALQLTMNFIWSILFFNFRLFLFSFVWLILLWAAILLMIYRFCTINKVAAWLQVPYLLWVTYAGALNLAIYLLNR